MDVFNVIYSSTAVLAALAILPTIFWVVFFYFFSKQQTLSRSVLSAMFLLGFLTVFGALLIERIVFYLLPLDFVLTLFGGKEITTPQEVIVIFLFSFFVIAFIEELLKYLIIYAAAIKFNIGNRIIDYVKIGMATGLGFATAENIYYFLSFHLDEVFTITAVFISRFFLATLAHIIYGAVLGYYTGHASMDKINSPSFLKKGLISAILIHGLFNFMVFTNVTFYNIILIAAALAVLAKWFQDRRLLEQKMNQPDSTRLFKPFLFEPLEMQNYLYASNASGQHKKDIIKKLSFCPYCLAKVRDNQEFCLHCNKKIA